MDDNLIYLEVVKDENGQLRLADRETGRYVALQKDLEANVSVHENPEDIQTVTLQVITDDRVIPEDKL